MIQILIDCVFTELWWFPDGYIKISTFFFLQDIAIILKKI